jgi:hypothetical protein
MKFDRVRATRMVAPALIQECVGVIHAYIHTDRQTDRQTDVHRYMQACSARMHTVLTFRGIHTYIWIFRGWEDQPWNPM